MQLCSLNSFDDALLYNICLGTFRHLLGENVPLLPLRRYFGEAQVATARQGKALKNLFFKHFSTCVGVIGQAKRDLGRG